MAAGKGHKWVFKARFRRGAFGWRSGPAAGRIREAVSEIKKAARKDKILGAEGAVLFLERLSPALERVDSSSGAIGTAVGRALAALVPILSNAPAGDDLRREWLERLWKAYPGLFTRLLLQTQISPPPLASSGLGSSTCRQTRLRASALRVPELTGPPGFRDGPW